MLIENVVKIHYHDLSQVINLFHSWDTFRSNCTIETCTIRTDRAESLQRRRVAN